MRAEHNLRICWDSTTWGEGPGTKSDNELKGQKPNRGSETKSQTAEAVFLNAHQILRFGSTYVHILL